jgi:hypothetical protein
MQRTRRSVDDVADRRARLPQRGHFRTMATSLAPVPGWGRAAQFVCGVSAEIARADGTQAIAFVNFSRSNICCQRSEGKSQG